YDLTNIGTLSAFAIVAIGVLALRRLDPSRPRPFRVPFVWPVAIGAAAACIYIMTGLPVRAWERFGIWMVLGIIMYFSYGHRHSRLRRERLGLPPDRD
ncbi:MAG: amino acid permease C-terminal domain-containing protein, partial [Gemmatimonadaceae bacterium]